MREANRFKTLYERLTGRPLDVQEPPENALTRKVIGDIHETVLDQGRELVKQTIIEANKVGLPPETLQYLFYLLVEQVRAWPAMPKAHRDALLIARNAMIRSDVVPNYRRGFQVPPEDLEASVDGVLKSLGHWAQSEMVANISGEYLLALRRNKPAADQLLHGQQGLEGKGVLLIKGLLQKALQHFPQWFPDADITMPALRLAMP